MAQPFSRHLWNAALLAASASVALAAERIAAAPVPRAPASDAETAIDVGTLVSRAGADSVATGFHASVSFDPFDARVSAVEQTGVASAPDAPTVPSSPSRGLTAILVADERRVAVIDDAAVSVGDVLPDGARVSAIQSDRVWVVEKNGRWRMLTLSNRGAR